MQGLPGEDEGVTDKLDSQATRSKLKSFGATKLDTLNAALDEPSKKKVT